MKPGSYYVGMRVDPYNKIPELKESNNTVYYGKITVKAAGIPDLVPVGFKLNATYYKRGQTVTAYGFVKNIGKGPVTYYKVDWRLSPNDAYSDKDYKLSEYNYYGTLNPGQQRSCYRTFKIPANAKTGWQYIGIRVDVGNKNKELSESNNFASKKIFVL